MPIFAWVLLTVGLFIVVVLAAMAYRAVSQLRQQQRQLQRAQEQRVSETSLSALEGVRILAGSYLAGQVQASEVSLRIAVLLDQPGHPYEITSAGKAFTEMAAKLAHIPTHQAWKDLPVARQRKLRTEMENLETQHQDELTQSAEALLGLLN